VLSALQAHITQFFAMLDAAFIKYGNPAGLPPRLRKAVDNIPRSGGLNRRHGGICCNKKSHKQDLLF
jgi:hypothetical protein